MTPAIPYSWRYRAAPVIAATLAATAGQPLAAVKAALRAAYPFGPREHYPYKAWCAEVRYQLAGQCRVHDDCLANLELARGCAARSRRVGKAAAIADIEQLNWLRANGAPQC